MLWIDCIGGNNDTIMVYDGKNRVIRKNTQQPSVCTAIKML